MNWIHNNWAKIGGIIALAIVIVLVSSENIKNYNSLLWLHLAVLMLHQFEEYVYPGKFQEFYLNHIWNKNKITRFPLTNLGVLIVNIVLGWSFYGLAIIFGTKYLWLVIGLSCVTILNGIMHTIMFIIKRVYNPGFFTGLFMIPFGAYLIFESIKLTSPNDISMSLIVFIIGTVLIPLSIGLTSKIKS